MEIERGFAEQTVLEKCLLLGEELGELFKSVREATDMSVDERALVTPVSDELADVLIMLCSVANRFDLNLEQSFRDKEAINEQRNWT